jgi:hypothetical protein
MSSFPLTGRTRRGETQMATWAEVSSAEPVFAARVRDRFDLHKHKTIATLRKDGSPRISGIEATFIGGDLWFGSMPAALKALDLRRDPRFALHGPSIDAGQDDPSAWGGDAKLSGLAVEVTDQAEIARLFRAMGAGPRRSPGLAPLPRRRPGDRADEGR